MTVREAARQALLEIAGRTHEVVDLRGLDPRALYGIGDQRIEGPTCLLYLADTVGVEVCQRIVKGILRRGWVLVLGEDFLFNRWAKWSTLQSILQGQFATVLGLNETETHDWLFGLWEGWNVYPSGGYEGDGLLLWGPTRQDVESGRATQWREVSKRLHPHCRD